MTLAADTIPLATEDSITFGPVIDGANMVYWCEACACYHEDRRNVHRQEE